MSPPRRFLIALAYATLFLYGWIDNARGPVFPDILREFTLDDTKGSAFFWCASLSALVANVTAPWWLAKLGEMGSLRIFSVIMGAALGLLAFAPTYQTLLTGALFFGVGMGGLGLLVNLLTASSSPAHLRRQLMSGLHCMYGVASLSIPIGVTALYEAGAGWRTVFALLALGPAGIFIASFGAPRSAPIEARDESAAARSFPYRRIVWYCASIAIYVIVEILVSTRLVLHARRDLGFSVEDANLLLSLFYVGMFAGRLFFALVRVPFSHVQLQYAGILTTLAAVVLGLTLHPGFLALSGLTMSYYYPVSMSRMSEELGIFTPRALTWVLAVQAIGLLAMHAGVGALSDAFGLSRALWVGPLCLALVTVLLVVDTLRAKVPRTDLV